MNIYRTLRTPAAAAAAVFAIATATLPASSFAAERLVLAGGEVSDAAYYSYLGTVLPIGQERDGRGWFQRYWVDAFGYEYLGGPGRVQADAYGLEAALGYRGGDARGWWAVSAGLRYTDTSLSPDDRSAAARGEQFGGKVQVEAEHQVGDAWRLGAMGSYSNEQDGYWGRVRLMHGSAERAFGVEAVAVGNEDFDSTAVGLVTTFKAAKRWTLGIRAGYRFQDDADGAYGGVEIGYGF